MDARRHRLVQTRGWDRAAASYAECWAAQLRPAHAALLDLARLASAERVIDVACGSGEVTVPAAQAVGPSGAVIGVDLAPKMVTRTVERVRSSTAAGVEGRCTSAEDLGIDGPFDVALCSLGLMYVPDPGKAIAELYRVLRPGGRVVASVWGERANCGWAGIFPIVDERVDTDVCPRFFALGAPGTLRAMFENAGFCDVDEHRLSVTLDFADDDSALAAAFVGGPVALAHARFDPATRRQAHEAYLASIGPFRVTDGGYRIPGEFVVVAAHRQSTHEPAVAT